MLKAEEKAKEEIEQRKAEQKEEVCGSSRNSSVVEPMVPAFVFVRHIA